MIPPLPVIAQALWILVPRKYRLSATLAGSAYHVSRAGVPAGCGAAGAGMMQRRRKVPDHSRPAAFLAALSRPSTVVGELCGCAKPLAAPKISAIPTPAATNFISFRPLIANTSACPLRVRAAGVLRLSPLN